MSGSCKDLCDTESFLKFFIKPKLLYYWAGHPLLWKIDLMAPSKKTPQHLSSWMLQQ